MMLNHNSHHAGFLRESQIVGRRATKSSPAIDGPIPIDRSTLWEWVKQGKFPQPVKLGEKTTAWRRADVDAWMEGDANGNPLEACVARHFDEVVKRLAAERRKQKTPSQHGGRWEFSLNDESARL